MAAQSAAGSSETSTEISAVDKQADDDTAQDADDIPVKSEIINGWFNEWIEISCGGHAMCLKVDEVLFHEKSPFQDILIFKRLMFSVQLFLFRFNFSVIAGRMHFAA